ncbi:hypothetical protein PISMIDRAFT_689141 [Pisolithus microcarpus 441]|uniref:Uncharacterized protein n=1 Tax=Pisolithus microcarpus 441 TaxID=765257 RepID=A0A0C9YY16_9AGAM|nr:hypothetical protein BKA83DRAFT_689141 [Pisolithus microcarpus]KIK12828.1 hypothetical protein PISMIDRAFT_689141 [Pisolithus microcarpus 441]
MLPSPLFNPGHVLHLLPECSFQCRGWGADCALLNTTEAVCSPMSMIWVSIRKWYACNEA